jgi:hypothetical protein
MANKDELIRYHKTLCDVLNKNGIKDIIRAGDGRIIEYDWKVDENTYDLTIMHLSSNREAFQFLLSKGLIRNNICQFCGERISMSKYRFTEPNNHFEFDICKSCYSYGKSVQNTIARSIKKFLKFLWTY